MMKVYAVQPYFYMRLKQHAMILNTLTQFEEPQRNLIFQSFCYEELFVSACSYFQERITMEHDALILNDQLNDRQYRMEYCQDHILIDSKENPFFKLLERKFHHRCIVITL